MIQDATSGDFFPGITPCQHHAVPEHEYQPPIPKEVRHAAMRWNAPLSDAHASMLLDEFELDRAERVLDLGCGWGELLLRALQRSPTLTGVGIDNDTVAIVRGRALSAQRHLDDRVSLIEAAAETWTESAGTPRVSTKASVMPRTSARLSSTERAPCRTVTVGMRASSC